MSGQEVKKAVIKKMKSRAGEKAEVKTKLVGKKELSLGEKLEKAFFGFFGKRKKLALACLALLYAAWVGLSLIASQLVVAMVLWALADANMINIESTTTQTVYSAVAYVLCVVVTVFLPWAVLKNKTTRDEMGLRGLPTWTDILLSPVGYIASLVVGTVVLLAVEALFPGFNVEEAQDVGFNNLQSKKDLLAAFFALVIAAPIAEELVFRGWLYGKLRARISALPAILVVSVLFGLVHGQWNVGIIVFVMSVAMCLLRELTGTIWSGILVHMIRNGVAFYMLFVA